MSLVAWYREVAEVYCSLVQRHRSDWVISRQSPDCPTMRRQSPDCPTLHRQWPDSLKLHRQWPDCPTLHRHSPDCSVLHFVCMGQLRRLCSRTAVPDGDAGRPARDPRALVYSLLGGSVKLVCTSECPL